MGKLALTLAVLFLSSVALSFASEIPENDVTAGDLASEMHDSTPTILLPSESEDRAASKLPENEPRTVESTEEVTTVTFRPADHVLDGPPKMPISFRFPFRHGRPCRHGRRPFKPSDLPARSVEIPYGNDMLVAEDHQDSEDSKDLGPWFRFHHHRHHHDHHHGEGGEMEEKDRPFQMMRHDEEGHGMKRFHHGRPRFERDDDDDEEEHDHHHHHHHHHHDHDDDDDEEHDHHHRHHHHDHDHHHHEEDGFLMKFRKFLADRF